MGDSKVSMHITLGRHDVLAYSCISFRRFKAFVMHVCSRWSNGLLAKLDETVTSL